MRTNRTRLRSVLGRTTAVTASALAAFAVVAPAASAGGTSGSTHGCYAKWWNTAFAGYCTPATQSGNFDLYGDCNNQADYSNHWRWIGSGSTVSPFDNSACRYSVSRSWVNYTSG